MAELTEENSSLQKQLASAENVVDDGDRELADKLDSNANMHMSVFDTKQLATNEALQQQVFTSFSAS